MITNKYIVDMNDEGERLDLYLSRNTQDLTRAFLQKLIKEEFVLVNGKIAKSNYRVKCNNEITMTIPEPTQVEIKPMNIDLDIVYDDKDIIIVNKPQGMVVHPAPGHYDDTIVNGLLYHYKDGLSGINGVIRPGIVHRIDKDTSGLLVICKNDYAHNFIAEQLKVHSVSRIYNSIVYFNVKEDECTINEMIGRHPTDRKKMCINAKNAKEAITHYKVLERYNNSTLIENKLETGRTHQIRVHMKSIGHPLIGDKVYGPREDKFKLQGQTLHARTLGFIHPTTKKYIEFNSDLPPYFVKIQNRLKNL